MKKISIVIIAIIFLLAIGVAAWGYLKGQEIKKQGLKLEQFTAGTLNLAPMDNSTFEIPLQDWKNVSLKASEITSQLNQFSLIPTSLKENLRNYYSDSAKNKSDEAQYLQILLDSQRKLGLKINGSASKGQIQSISTEFDTMQMNLKQNPLSSQAKFNDKLNKMLAEGGIFKTNLSNLQNSMSFDGSGIQLPSAGFDKAIDEFKLALVESLNEQVDLQNKIKDDIAKMTKVNWVRPF